MPHQTEQAENSPLGDPIITMDTSIDRFAETLVSNVEVYRVNESGSLSSISDTGTTFMILASEAAENQFPCLASSDALPDNVAAAIAIPVICGPKCTSVIVLVLRPSKSFGVLEIWKPVGRYAELGLVDGYFGALERFHNVSSFVRFERGMGLPGQAWERGYSVIHKNLPNHPGFLRAAGASAESLESAVGIPISGDEFIATVVLINSSDMPIARGMQSWVVDGASLALPGDAASGSGNIEDSNLRSRFSAELAWLRQSMESREASWHLSESNGASVAIPTFVGGKPRGVLALRF